MDTLQAKQLMEKYLSGTCTPEEKALVERAYNRVPLEREEREEEVYQRIAAAAWEDVERGMERQRRGKVVRNVAWAAASVVLLILGAVYLLKPDAALPKPELARQLKDVEPGGDKAVLVLGDGSKIALDSASGRQMVQSNSKITIHGGEVVYSPENNSYDPNVVNTIVTPKGGQFQLKLSDGTKVRLNAASVLTFAPTFDGKAQRVVKLSGEAYFEVAHDARHPFIVETSQQRIQVLGTRFNVHAYPDENAVTTSLLAGKVSISTSLNSSNTLNPGQAAITDEKTTRLVAADEYAVAWTEGQIRFKDADLKTILLPVSRWYNVKVIYESEPSKELYSGGILKKNSLSTFLRILDSRNVRYELRQDEDGAKLLIIK